MTITHQTTRGKTYTFDLRPLEDLEPNGVCPVSGRKIKKGSKDRVFAAPAYRAIFKQYLPQLKKTAPTPAAVERRLAEQRPSAIKSEWARLTQGQKMRFLAEALNSFDRALADRIVSAANTAREALDSLDG